MNDGQDEHPERKERTALASDAPCWRASVLWRRGGGLHSPRSWRWPEYDNVGRKPCGTDFSEASHIYRHLHDGA